MKAKTYEKRIREACQEAGTYRPFFESTISTLASILERRDEANDCYEKAGDGPVVEYTNKAGMTNTVKNPALAVWDDLNKSALAYWRDLGLTPAGLKKIDESALKEKKGDAFSNALSSLLG